MTDTQAMTVRLPHDLYEWLRKEAFDRHASQASIIIKALAMYRDQRGLLSETEKAVWALWNTLPDGEPSPVKRIARTLLMDPADVAFIVYPAEKFGRWDDSQEPDLTA